MKGVVSGQPEKNIRKACSMRIACIVLVTALATLYWSTAVFAEMTCTDEGGGVISCGNNTGTGVTSYAPTVTTTTTVNVDGDSVTAAATSGASGTGAAIGLHSNVGTTSAPDLTINLIRFDSLTSNFSTGAVVDAYCDDSGNATITIGENAGAILSTNASGAQPKGVRARTSSGNAIINMEGGSIETSGTKGYGVRARSVSDGDSTVTISGDSVITTHGDNSYGIISSASDTNSGTASVNMTGGTITTNGDSSHGIYSENSGGGNAEISIGGNSSITTTGTHTYGAYSFNENGTSGNTAISMTGGSIQSVSRGLYSSNYGDGTADIIIDGDATVETTGERAAGAASRIGVASNSSDATVEMKSGTIRTSGDLSAGLRAVTLGAGDAIVDMSGGSVTTTGEDSHGLNARTVYGNSSVTVTGGTIDAGNGYAISAETQFLSTRTDLGTSSISISGGTLTGSQGAVYNDDGNSNTTISGDNTSISGDFVLNGGADTLTISGGTITLNSGIYGGGGDDTFVLNGGSVTGDFYGEEGDDGFTWSGGELNSGFYGGDGSDTAAVSATDYDGNQIFDGGDDTSVDDGYIDELTFSGVTVNAKGANIINWEVLTLDQSTALTITDGSITAGDGSDTTGIYVANGSTIDGGSALTVTGNLNIDSSSQFIGTGSGSGVYVITFDLSNSGSVDTHDGTVGDRVTVEGDYSGDGALKLDTDFSTGSTDILSVSGNISTDEATIEINDLASTTAFFSSEIVLIDASNDSDKSDENFVLAESNRYNGDSTLGRWSSSPFIWRLKTSGGNYVLGDAYELPSEDSGDDDPGSDSGEESGETKPAVVSEIPAEVSLPTFSYEVSVNKLNTLHQRLGELRKHDAWANFDAANGQTSGLYPPVSFDENRLNAWARSTYAGFNIDADDNFEVDGRYGLVQIGFDHKLGDQQNTIYAGFYGSYIRGYFDNSGEGGKYGSLFDATTDMDGWAGGIYGTWMNTYGTYVDLVIDYTMLEAKIESVDTLNTDGETISGSIEAGQSLTFMHKLVLEPQLQVKVAHVIWDSFHDGYSDVTFDDHTYVTGRAGLRTEYTMFRTTGLEIKPWLYAGAQHEFTDDPNITNVIDFKSHDYDTTGNVQVGITWEDTDMFQFYADVGYTTDFDIYDAWRFDAGMRIRF